MRRQVALVQHTEQGIEMNKKVVLIKVRLELQPPLIFAHVKSPKRFSAREDPKVMSTRIQYRLTDFDKTSNQLRNPCLRTWSISTWVEKEFIRTNITSCT